MIMTNVYRLYKGTWIFREDPHREQKLSKSEIASLLANGGVMVRNTYDFDCKEDTDFYFVIKDNFGGFGELSSKMRNQIRRCFKTMSVRRISADFLLEEGYEVYKAAAENYSVKSIPPTIQEFKDRLNSGEENDYWGCFDLNTGSLVAFSMNAVTEESCEYRTLKAIPEFQRKYAYYGLIYTMNQYYLEHVGLQYVNDGARSITQHSNIQLFLIEKFNFRKAYCHLEITYKRWFGIIVKVLYPFRKYIPMRSVQAILRQEEYNRKNKN